MVAAARVPARAGGGVLGLRVPDAHGRGAGHRLPRRSGPQEVAVGVRAGRRQHDRRSSSSDAEGVRGAAARAGRGRRWRLRARPGRGSCRSRRRRWSTTSIPTRPESRAGAARGRRRAAARRPGAPSRSPPATTTSSAPGSRYIDCLIPGLLGHEPHGHRPVGHRLLGRGRAHAQAAQAADRDADARAAHYLPRTCCRGWCSSCSRSAALLAFALLRVRRRAGRLDRARRRLVLLGALAFAGLGLLVATRALRTIEGVSGLDERRDDADVAAVRASSSRRRTSRTWSQPFIRLLPLTALIDALRGVFLDGYGPAAIGREIATLTIYTVATFGLSVKLFRWR